MNSSEESFISASLDLHVLSTPPAFILSQDQTLNKSFAEAAADRLAVGQTPLSVCPDSKLTTSKF